MTKTDETQRDLDSMAKLIAAVKKDPTLLQNDEVRIGFDHAVDAHKTLVSRLAKQLGMPEPSHRPRPRNPEAFESFGSHSKTCHQGYSEEPGHSFERHQEPSGSSYGDYSRRMENSESTYHQIKRSTSHHRLSEYREVSESSYQLPLESQLKSSDEAKRLLEHIEQLSSAQRHHRKSNSPKGPVRIAPAPPTASGPSASTSQVFTPSRRFEHSDSDPRNSIMKRASSLHSRLSKPDVQEILREATDRHLSPSESQRRFQNPSTSSGTSGVHGASRPRTANHINTSSAMPSGHLLTSTMTKHVPRYQVRYQQRYQDHERHNLATSSQVVEESFLEDALSTTRDAPTIVDEVVEQPVKNSNGQLKKKSKTSAKKTTKTVHLNPVPLQKRSKSMQNVSVPVPRSEYIPQTTVPKPFQLSLRKSIENTYAKKFMSDMMDEKKKQEENKEKSLKNVKFRAKPVPKSTYQPTNTFATEVKYVEAMRRKVEKMAKKKFEAETEMVRSKSEGNLAMLKPLGYVPPSTYISPIPVKPNARSRSATTRSAILIQEATTPKGIKSHRATSNLTHHLRHGRCKLDTSTVVLHRRMSPPDFQKIHAKVKETHNHLSGKPSTVPQPFNFANRSRSASTRHTNCKEKEPGQFKKPQDKRRIGSAQPNPRRIATTHAAQLREELNKARLDKEKAENGDGSGKIWKEDNRKRIATFLGSRSKTDEDIAIRTRRKIQQQQETTQEYIRKLAEMNQRVLNGPLIMEKQTALAQEHRLKRKFAQRMKESEHISKSSAKSSRKASESSRRTSEASAAGTFVVEKEEYEQDFDEEGSSEVEEDGEGESESEAESEAESGSESGSESESDNEAPGSAATSGSESGSSSKSKPSDDDSSVLS